MAHRVQQHPVGQRVRPAHHPRNQVMVVPAGVLRDDAAAQRAVTVLRQEQRRPLLVVRLAFQQALRAQVFAICLPLRVEGAVVPLDLLVAHDLRIGEPIQLHPFRRAVLGRGPDCELRSALDGQPVLPGHPLRVLRRMPATCPARQPPPQQRVEFAERLLGDHRSVVLSPASQDRVQQLDEVRLLHRLMRHHDLPDLAVERFHVLLARLDQQDSRVLPEIPAQEIEPLVDVRDSRLRRRQSQPSLCEERFHPWPHFALQEVFRRSCDHEVIGVPDHMDFELLDLRLAQLRTEVRVQARFQSVQCHVRQGWRDDSALRRTCFGCRQLAFVDHSCLQPLVNDAPVHADVLQQPLVVDMVKTAFDVRLQHPWGRGLLGEAAEQLAHGIGRRAISPKAVAVRVALRLHDGLQTQQVESLHRPVLHRWNAQRALRHLPWGCRPAVTARAGTPSAASTCRQPSICRPAYSTARGRRLPSACLGSQSLVAPPVPWRRTSGSATVAGLSPGASHLSALPSLSVSASFSPAGRSGAN